ncbi:moubatin-like [Ornithodoros turicata]|uniref:moubatin-like n=1 Tax=Ornithodoros turicata TaxID=34597 RepID=UPI003138ACD6
MLRTLHVLFLALCLLRSVAVATDDCDSKDTPDAWEAITLPGSGEYLLQSSTQANPRDCLRGVVPTNPTKPNATITMKYKAEKGGWEEKEWKFHTEGDKISATLGDRTLTGTVIFDAKGKCHIDQLPDGAYSLWKHSSASDNETDSCQKKFDERTKGKTTVKPQEKDCPTEKVV